MHGIGAAFRAELNFKIHCLAAFFIFAILIYFRAQPIWWALISLVVGSVLAAELVNTALEAMIDRVHPEIHPMIGKAKDCAAGAVLVLSIASLGVFAAFLCATLG